MAESADMVERGIRFRGESVDVLPCGRKAEGQPLQP